MPLFSGTPPLEIRSQVPLQSGVYQLQCVRTHAHRWCSTNPAPSNYPENMILPQHDWVRSTIGCPTKLWGVHQSFGPADGLSAEALAEAVRTSAALTEVGAVAVLVGNEFGLNSVFEGPKKSVCFSVGTALQKGTSHPVGSQRATPEKCDACGFNWKPNGIPWRHVGPPGGWFRNFSSASL